MIDGWRFRARTSEIKWMCVDLGMMAHTMFHHVHNVYFMKWKLCSSLALLTLRERWGEIICAGLIERQGGGRLVVYKLGIDGSVCV